MFNNSVLRHNYGRDFAILCKFVEFYEHTVSGQTNNDTHLRNHKKSNKTAVKRWWRIRKKKLSTHVFLKSILKMSKKNNKKKFSDGWMEDWMDGWLAGLAVEVLVGNATPNLNGNKNYCKICYWNLLLKTWVWVLQFCIYCNSIESITTHNSEKKSQEMNCNKCWQ